MPVPVHLADWFVLTEKLQMKGQLEASQQYEVSHYSLPLLPAPLH